MKGWDWGDPPTFGGVCNGKSEIFLCQNGQGSRGGPLPRHVKGDDDTGGVWMTWWVASPNEVDAAYELALKQGLTVLTQPTDEPWNVRDSNLCILTDIRSASVPVWRKNEAIGD